MSRRPAQKENTNNSININDDENNNNNNNSNSSSSSSSNSSSNNGVIRFASNSRLRARERVLRGGGRYMTGAQHSTDISGPGTIPIPAHKQLIWDGDCQATNALL